LVLHFRAATVTLLVGEYKRVTPKTPSSPQLALLFGAAKVAEESSPVPNPAPRRSRERRTWLVHQLVAEARDLVEAEFGDVWVEGEMSNLRPASSGHLYFTLKDAEAQLPVVLFRRQAILLRFRPEDGLQVRVRGKVSVYEQRGQLQLVAETLEPVGAGNLQLAFEQLRDRLKAEGLFDQERKRPLPAFPRIVAVITSPTGAVIRDFLNIVNRRHSGLTVLVVPAAVQGDSAPAEIEAAITQANDSSLPDLIVLARGGGSLEDLAAFNSERVARAIASSRLPVVSAIGHETDFTIADFVADLRAPTPSAAAELITEAQHKVEELVAALSNRLIRAARFQLLQARQRLGHIPVSYAEQRLITSLHRMEQRLDDLSFRMESAIGETLRRHQRAAAELAAAILRHDPRQQLSTAREALAASQSRLSHALDRRLTSARHRNQSLEARLFRAVQVAVANRRAAYSAARGQLQSLSPLAVLQRGYALVQDENGSVIRSVERLTANQSLSTRLGDGTFSSRITAIQANQHRKKKKDKPASQ
jgi:exodeoxyribonuclease VII large subunit